MKSFLPESMNMAICRTKLPFNRPHVFIPFALSLSKGVRNMWEKS